MYSGNPQIVFHYWQKMIVPTTFKLENETTTPNEIRVYSCTDGVTISSSKGNMNINLPPKARVAHKMN